MTRKLIVSGDDLGIHEAINRGVLEAHEEGIVTSASIVPCGRAFDHACKLVEKRKKLGIGIHLTLVEERPLLGPDVLKTLAPKGRLPKNYRQLFFGLVKGRIHTEEIELELDAQIQRVLTATSPSSRDRSAVASRAQRARARSLDAPAHRALARRDFADTLRRRNRRPSRIPAR